MTRRSPLDLGFLKSKPKIRANRVKALVAFGDMSDFGAWTRRGSNSPEEFRAFMVRLYQEFIKFRNGNGYFVKLMGDGFMAIREIRKGDAGRTAQRFVLHSLDLCAAVNQIGGSTFPAPGAFRVRIVAGHVWKLMAARQEKPDSAQTDYLGYTINLGARLLEIERDTAILCHGSVKKILNGWNGWKAEFRLGRVVTRSRCPRGIDPEDLKVLWSVQPLKYMNRAQTNVKSTIPT